MVSFSVVYEDEWLVVLNKPTGMLSVPGIGTNKRDCLANRVGEAYKGARIVHRLDRDTSGVIAMAMDADTHRELSRQFQDREVEKKYIAMVWREVEVNEGRIDLPIRKDFDNPPRQKIDYAFGRDAVTNWRVVERYDDRTRLELRPITGRSHQLRLHLREVGHPILGDDLYATPEALGMADRLMLHATELVIVHPQTNKRMTFSSSCPF